ncbi:sugar ABC transporter permease, partial [bacterium]
MTRARTTASWGWEFVAPALLIVGLFVVVPCIWGIAMSFSQFDAISPARYVGTHNYERLANDPLVWSTFQNTALYVLFTLPVSLALALAIALALHQKWFTGRNIIRGIYFLPNVTSLAAVAFVWEWILNP